MIGGLAIGVLMQSRVIAASADGATVGDLGDDAVRVAEHDGPGARLRREPSLERTAHRNGDPSSASRNAPTVNAFGASRCSKTVQTHLFGPTIINYTCPNGTAHAAWRGVGDPTQSKPWAVDACAALADAVATYASGDVEAADALVTGGFEEVKDKMVRPGWWPTARRFAGGHVAFYWSRADPPRGLVDGPALRDVVRHKMSLLARAVEIATRGRLDCGADDDLAGLPAAPPEAPTSSAPR